MLASFKYFFNDFRWYLPIFLLLIFSSSRSEANQIGNREICIQSDYYQNFIYYFNTLHDESNVDDVIDELIFLHQSLRSQGCLCPSLSEICNNLFKVIVGTDIEIDESAIQELIHKIEIREIELSCSHSESQFQFVKHKHKHKEKHHGKDKEFKMGSKGIFGFVKILAGGLMCLVPVPIVQGAGAALISYGINDIIDDTRENGDETERQNKIEENRRKEQELLMQPSTP